MGVQLGVQRPAGVLAEAGGGDALGVEGAHLAVDAVAGVGVVLDPVDHGRHRRVVGVEHRGPGGVVAQGEEHRHRLGGRRGDVEAPHRSLAVVAAEGLAGAGVESGHEGQEGVVVDLVHQPEAAGAETLPLARGLARVEVVAGQGLDVIEAGVGPLERRDPHRHRHHPTGVHSSVLICDGGGWAVGVEAVGRVGGSRTVWCCLDGSWPCSGVCVGAHRTGLVVVTEMPVSRR